MSDDQRSAANVALARAYVSEAARMIVQPLACWDLFTPEQREQYLETCLANLTRARRRAERAEAAEPSARAA